jgi:UDPglucose 6-dehydrogenase
LQKLSFVGLGKLGLCMATCLAVKGNRVIGIDINKAVVDLVGMGVSPIVEPGLQEYITRASRNLSTTQDHREAVEQTDITYIMVATPSTGEGSFSNRYVEIALQSLAEDLGRSKKKFHIFVISCTVMPGSIAGSFIPLIEKASGRQLNKGFAICYDPDFVALGSVIHDYLNPDFVVIGESSPEAGERVAAIHRGLCDNNPPLFRMPLIDAEITKVALNCYICTKISFANALANLCEKIPGANVDNVTRAIGSDKRISPYYLRGGLSYGGTCFPRDTVAFKAASKKFGYRDELIEAVDRVNEYQHEHLLDLTLQCIEAAGDNKVSILGLAFKPDTPVVEESPSLRLIGSLLERGVQVSTYDPLAVENTRAIFGDRIGYADSVRNCMAQSGVTVITIMDSEFKQIDDSMITREPTTIIDCWRILEPSRFAKEVKYVAYDIGSTYPGPEKQKK